MERIHGGEDLRNREARNEAKFVGLGLLAGGHTQQIAEVMARGPVGSEVVRRLVTGRMLELDVRILLGDVQREVLIAEALRKDQLRPLANHVFHDALGVRSLWDVLRLEQLDARDVRHQLGESGVLSFVVSGILHGAHVERAHDQTWRSRSNGRTATAGGKK